MLLTACAQRYMALQAGPTGGQVAEGLELDDHGGHVVAALAVPRSVGRQAVVAQGLANAPGGPALLQAPPHKGHCLRPATSLTKGGGAL